MGTFNLKQWREANGYSKVKLAKALDLSRWTIARMEETAPPRYVELACKALEADEFDASPHHPVTLEP